MTTLCVVMVTVLIVFQSDLANYMAHVPLNSLSCFNFLLLGSCSIIMVKYAVHPLNILFQSS